jgi:hypothetical protein
MESLSQKFLQQNAGRTKAQKLFRCLDILGPRARLFSRLDDKVQPYLKPPADCALRRPMFEADLS